MQIKLIGLINLQIS